MIKECDVLVIGSGPGGYVAAIRCAQLGMKTILAEKYSSLGGTCLNVGCIPSKALLDSSELYLQAAHRFKEHGIQISGLKPDFEQMMKRKNGVIAQTVEGIRFLMKKNKIEVLEGIASFTSPTEVIISEGKDKGVQIKAANYIIATGSKPSTLKGVPVDEKRVITSTGALALTEIPKSLVIIGGGVIGLELGSVYSRLGTSVSVVEYMDGLIPSMDRSLGRELMKVLEKEGMKFYLNHSVKEVKASAKKVKLVASPNAGGDNLELEADYCLLSTGRSAYTEGLGLDKAGIKTDERGKIPVNGQLHTGVGSIYAIGDVVKGAMLAHKAEDEGVFVAETIAGQKPHIDYLLIPNVVYTWPEVAAVGYTEEELKSQGRKYRSGSFPFKASGRARASMDTDGFIKVLADHDTDEILGVHMIGPRVADMIAEAVTAMEFRASAEDMARMSHAHPTYTEAFKEACLAASGLGALHL